MDSHLQNYAFKYRGIKFVCLDFVTRIPTPFGLGVGSDAVLHPNTTKWLKDHLVESEPTILFSHHPLVWNPTLAFEGYELINIADVIRNSHVDVKAHFAGHIHGFNRFAFQLDVFMDANHEYEFMNFNSTTTEALMVGGNELKAGGVKGIIRIVEVYGKDIWYEPNRAEGDFPSLNPYLYLQSAKRREVGEVVKFEISPFQKGRTFKYRLEWGEDNTKAEGQSSTDALVTHSYEKHGNYLVNLTVWDANDPSLVEYITRNVLVEDVGEVWNPYGITCSESTVPILWNGANVAENPQNTPEYVTLLVKHSEPIPVASLMVHFENATGNIDLTSAIVDANLEERKSIIYMPSWPDVIELSKVLYIPSTGKGAVYICKNAKTLDEVNFINADIVISVGETKDGMTLSTTIYNGVEYYVVFNITGTGGGEIDNIPPEIGKLVQEPSEDIMAYQNVTVTVNVTDLGTGIFNVTLWYSIDNGTPWILLNMNEVSPDIYQATIPGYDDGIWVTYKIVAYDNTGNSAVKDNNGYYYKYHVIPEFTSAIILPLFILTTLTATVLLKKKRRMKPQLP